MTLKKYGVLKGTVTGHLRDADDDHYQILVTAGRQVHRVAVNVLSSAPNAPSTLLFLSSTKLPEAFRSGLTALPAGYRKLRSRAGGLALDYVRLGWFRPGRMVEVPPDEPGADNDLKDKLERAVLAAASKAGSIIYAFGEKWGPEQDRRDQYFRFLPGNGIHDIHMNQGNDGKYRKDNGVFQDGALVFSYPDDKWLAFFLAFQTQSFETDDEGNPSEPSEQPSADTRSGERKAVRTGGPKRKKSTRATRATKAGSSKRPGR